MFRFATPLAFLLLASSAIMPADGVRTESQKGSQTMKENNTAINNELAQSPVARREITELAVRADEIQEIISRRPGFLEK